MTLRLNVGAGQDIRQDWRNIDARPLAGIDLVLDINKSSYSLVHKFEGQASEILLQDVLEHIDPNMVPRILQNLWKCLQSGGILTLRIPDVKKIARKLTSGALDDETAILLLYGDQSPDAGGTEFGSHRWGYTEPTIRRLLTQVGFEVVSVESPSDQHNLLIMARKP